MAKFTAKQIELSSGERVGVGLLKWGAWCQIKERLVELLSSRLVELARSAGAGGDLASIGKWLSNESLSVLPSLAGELMRIVDTLTEDIVRGCVAELPDDLPAVDWVLLRAEALEVNDIAALVEAEKNFLGEVVGGAAKKVGSAMQTGTTSRGGADGNTLSPAGTDGPRV